MARNIAVLPTMTAADQASQDLARQLGAGGPGGRKAASGQPGGRDRVREGVSLKAGKCLFRPGACTRHGLLTFRQAGASSIFSASPGGAPPPARGPRVAAAGQFKALDLHYCPMTRGGNSVL